MNTTNARPNGEGFFSHPERQVLLAYYMTLQKPGDRQVLSDETLQAALAGEQGLVRAQWQAMLDSPLTLCRLRFLEAQRQAAQAGDETVDDGWQRSTAEVLAASDTEADCSLVSPDGRWALHALTTRGVTRLLLQLSPASLASAGAAPAPGPGAEVAVLDDQGGTLLMGHLDADGELQARWTRDTDLRTHLARHGGHWHVQWRVEPV